MSLRCRKRPGVLTPHSQRRPYNLGGLAQFTARTPEEIATQRNDEKNSHGDQAGRGHHECEQRIHHAAFFSRRTPLNFFLLFFTAMNLPPFLLRFAHAGPPSSLILIWERLRTAPSRA